MKKILFLAALVFAALQLTAANVDLVTAQQNAQRFLMSHTAQGRLMNSTPTIKWTHEVKNSKDVTLAAYYIVNTDKGYVIVPGDDRAREVLAYGEGSLENLNDIPENMQFFLDMYKAEMEYLQAHPGQVVKTRNANLGQSVDPLLTTIWNQGSTGGRSPFNRNCPKIGSSPCLTGCAAVALSQVMNYYEYPAGCPALPAYTGERGVYVPALDPITFDWANMRDKYTNDNWSEDERDAIANLMRYVGQAEFMDYYTDKSGADEDQILMALRLFGYDAGTHYELKNAYDAAMTELINDDDWTTMMQTELIVGRPLIYGAFSAMSTGSSYYGHVFNVDGYDAANDLYHVNFGQTASNNDWYAFNAFGYGITVYKYFQLMFVDLKPTPEGVAIPPRIIVHPWYNYPEINVGGSATISVDMIGVDLTGDITVTVNDENGFLSTDVSTITLSQLDAANHKVIDVIYHPTDDAGVHFAYITLSSPGAEPVYVYFYSTANGISEKVAPVMQPTNEEEITSTSFMATWHHKTSVDLVRSYTLEVGGNVITGITDKSYVVEGLTAGTTYTYRVKAVYTDGTESAWSNTETVTLPGGGPAYERGDVNRDGKVNIGDVTTLINMLLSNAEYDAQANCSLDGRMNIGDVTALIQYLLGGVW